MKLPEPSPSAQESHVLVTSPLGKHPVDLAARQIEDTQAADLRGRLNSMAQDWERPEMDVYDVGPT